jgi:hypothetical protein
MACPVRSVGSSLLRIGFRRGTGRRDAFRRIARLRRQVGGPGAQGAFVVLFVGVEELVVGGRRQALQGPPLVEHLPGSVQVGAQVGENFLIGRRCLRRRLRRHHGAVRAIGRGPVLVHDLQSPGLDFGVLVPGQADQVRVAFIGGLLPAVALRFAEQAIPLLAMLDRPVLAGLDAAMDFPGNGGPGVADGAHFGRGFEKGFQVVRHDEFSGHRRATWTDPARVRG